MVSCSLLWTSSFEPAEDGMGDNGMGMPFGVLMVTFSLRGVTTTWWLLYWLDLSWVETLVGLNFHGSQLSKSVQWWIFWPKLLIYATAPILERSYFCPIFLGGSRCFRGRKICSCTQMYSQVGKNYLKHFQMGYKWGKEASYCLFSGQNIHHWFHHKNHDITNKKWMQPPIY